VKKPKKERRQKDGDVQEGSGGYNEEKSKIETEIIFCHCESVATKQSVASFARNDNIIL
jgi:hypothetical protein